MVCGKMNWNVYILVTGVNVVTVCRYLQEYTALGTAGGLYHFRDQILAGTPDYFFVMNADVCGDFPLQEMLKFHQSKPTGTYCTILGAEVLYFITCTLLSRMTTFECYKAELNF